MAQESLINIAKAPAIAYTEKDRDAARAFIAAGFFYDEVATHRRCLRTNGVITVWREWGSALPDCFRTDGFDNQSLGLVGQRLQNG